MSLLLVIPPPAGSAAPQGGFPTNLAGINLPDWAALVQDMVVGLQVLLPSLSNSLGLQVVNLLQLLEAATGVGFCHFRCHPEPHCRCMGVSQSAPPTSWSQILEQAPGYGVTASSGRVTTPSTSLGGMSEYVAPPPGLSIWSMPPLEASLPKGPVVSPLIQTSHWESCTAKGHPGQAGSGAASSSDGTTHLPATSISQGPASNPVPAGSVAAR